MAEARIVREVRVLFGSILLSIAGLSLSRSVGARVADEAWRFRRAFIIMLPFAIPFGLVAALFLLWGTRSRFARRRCGVWAAAGAAVGLGLALLWVGVLPHGGGFSDLMMFAPYSAVCGAAVGVYGYLEAKSAGVKLSARQ
jgi:hypothetical protein